MPTPPEMPPNATAQEKERWFRDYRSFLVQQQAQQDHERTLARHGIKTEQPK